MASYSPYQLLYERELILLSSIREKLAHVVDLDDLNIWAKYLQKRVQFFQRAMPMAMEILYIAQHCHTLHYACIRSGAYRTQLRRLWQGDYVYLQRVAPTTLDVRAGRTILRVKEVLPSRLLLLEDTDGKDYREHSKNYAPCHLSIEDTIHSKLAVMLEGHLCFVCEEKK